MSERSFWSPSNGELLKAPDVAKILNISKTFAYKLMRTGKIRTVKIERALRVRQADLDEYIQKNLDPPQVFWN